MDALQIEEHKNKDDEVVVAPVEEEAVPGAGVGGDWLPQQPRDGRQPRGLHRGEVPRPRVAQPAQLVRAGDQLQAPVLPCGYNPIFKILNSSILYRVKSPVHIQEK